MASDLVRVGIIGTGVGIRTYLPAFRALDDARVVAIAGSSVERSKAYASQYSIDKAMDARSLCAHRDIDLVCVTSPNLFHRADAEAALIAGKHVLCEKPLAMSMRETSELIAIASQKPAQLALVNHQLRFNPYIKKVRASVKEGMIGRPYYLRLHQQSRAFTDRDAPWTWSFDARQGGGVRLAMASHLIDLVHHWLGETATTVCGAMDPVVHARQGPNGARVQIKASSFVGASLQLESGVTVHLSATAAACGRSGFEFSLYGEEGELHFDLTNKLRGAFLSKQGELKVIPVDGVTDRERDNRVSIFSGSFVYFAAEIVRAIKLGDWSRLVSAAKFADAAGVQLTLDALAVSANRGEMYRLTGRERNDDYV